MTLALRRLQDGDAALSDHLKHMNQCVLSLSPPLNQSSLGAAGFMMREVKLSKQETRSRTNSTQSQRHWLSSARYCSSSISKAHSTSRGPGNQSGLQPRPSDLQRPKAKAAEPRSREQTSPHPLLPLTDVHKRLQQLHGVISRFSSSSTITFSFKQ